MIIRSTVVLFSIGFILSRKSGLGRPPERIDHIACQVQMFERLDKIQEIEDPYASVEAYFNKTGFPCQTYCLFRSRNINVAKITTIIDSPYYVMCARDRFCSKGGKCMRMGTPLKLDDCQTTNQESPQTSMSGSPSTVKLVAATPVAANPGPTPVVPGISINTIAPIATPSTPATPAKPAKPEADDHEE